MTTNSLQLPPGVALPALDIPTESAAVVAAIDALPPELSDRNPGSVAVKIAEAMGAFYGPLAHIAEAEPLRLWLRMLRLLGVQPLPATPAVTTLRFTKSPEALGVDVIVDAGAVVRSGYGSGAVVFRTLETLLIPATVVSGDVTAACVTNGATGNVAAGRLTVLSTITAGVASVTNPAAASGGADAETLQALVDRAPLAIRASERAVAAADFEALSLQVPGIVRASVQSFVPGQVSVVVLDQADNQGVDAVTAPARSALIAATVPGVAVAVSRAPVTLFALRTAEVQLRPGFSLYSGAAPVAVAIEAAVNNAIQARSWNFGESLFSNEVSSEIDRLAGVKRVGNLSFSTSDDGGATWTEPAPLLDGSPVEPSGGPVVGLFSSPGLAAAPSFVVTEL
jgi:uncharacterized phage protein gp47/JayE